MKKINWEKYLCIGAVVLSAVFMRLIPHIPNVSPIAALALFSGVMIPSGAGLLIPLIAMGLSDIILGFHSTIPFVYGSFLIIAGVGYLIRKEISVLGVTLGSLVGSILFFVVTNFGVWATSSMYTKNISGLLHCYTMGLPFFRNTLLGDLFYTAIFFLGYRFVKLLFVLMLSSVHKTERHIGNTV